MGKSGIPEDVLRRIDTPFNEIDQSTALSLFFNTIEATMAKLNIQFQDAFDKNDQEVKAKAITAYLDAVYSNLLTIGQRASFVAGLRWEDHYRNEIAEKSEKLVELGVNYIDANMGAIILTSHIILQEVCESQEEVINHECDNCTDADRHNRNESLNLIKDVISNVATPVEEALRDGENSEQIDVMNNRGYRNYLEESENPESAEEDVDIPDAFKDLFGGNGNG